MENDVKLAICISLFWLLISCQRYAASPAPPPEIVSDLQTQQLNSASRPAAEISISEISLGSCMSLALLTDRLSDPMFDYPSALMITDFHVLDESVTPNNVKFLAYSSFYYKTGPTKDVVPFTKIYQSDCKTLQLQMASERLLTYEILESSDRNLRFKLKKEFGDEVPDHQRDALFKRYQADEISVQYISDSEIKIVKKIKSFDPLCKKKKKGYDLQVSETFSWKRNTADLPQNYPVDKGFLGLVLSSLKTPPEVDAENPVPVATIKDIMLMPVLDETKLCN
jgi:hypothetical protein